MPTGLTTTWGYPVGAVANQFQTMMAGDHPLTYELGMTSYPPSFAAGYGSYGSNLQSPILSAGYTPQSAFGRTKRRSKSKRKTRSKSKRNQVIPKNIKKLCKRLKIKLTRKVGKRRVNKSLKQLKKQIARKIKTQKKKLSRFGKKKKHNDDFIGIKPPPPENYE
jgi:hypothetical protein